MRTLAALIVTVSTAWAAPGLAETTRTVEGRRVTLVDVLPEAPMELALIDLGEAPDPGASRLFSKAEIVRQVRRVAADARLGAVPETVRVVSAARLTTRAELAKMVEPVAASVLPSGVRLVSVTAPRDLKLSPQATIGSVELGAIPKKPGRSRISAMAEILHDEEVVLRMPVALTVELTETAASHVVVRGARLKLVIDRGGAVISADALALGNGDTGEIVQFQVQSTRKVLRARIESARLARVVME